MNEQSAVLDQAVLRELRESVAGDEAFVSELAGAYLAEGAMHLDAMSSAADANDPAAIVRPAHTLKSSSAALGAMRLADTCRNIESAGREGRAEGMVEAVAEAREAWSATVEALRGAGLAQ